MKYFLYLLLVTVPGVSLASHTARVDLDDLDGDVVEELMVPVLFGIDFKTLVPDYGAPRGGGTRSHQGQDFLAPQGTPIVTPTEAVVLGVGTWPGGGKYVQTANPGGERFRYMHLHELADIDVGDKLSVGDYIGTVGDTGNAAPGAYHLHFETLDEDGDPQDPYVRLAGEFSLEDKMDFLDGVFRDRRDDGDYAEFLVETFPKEFRAAIAAEVDLPRAVQRAVDDMGWQTDTITGIAGLRAQLARLQLQLQILLLQQQLASLQR